jgi:hypothetical protein
VTLDAEFEAWREEWRAETEPVHDLKRKIRRQRVRTIAVAILMCLCLALSTIQASRKPSPFMSGFAAGLWLTAIFVGGYAWWVKGGAWKPSTQTALAYAELSYKAAVARARVIRLSFWVSLGAIAALSCALTGDCTHVTIGEGLVLAALIAEAVAFRHYRQRKEREIAKTRELLDDLKG